MNSKNYIIVPVANNRSIRNRVQFQTHQDRVLTFIKNNPHTFGLLIAHTMGSGKTVLGLAIAHMYPTLQLVVVGPKILQFVWKSECERFGFSKCNFKFIPDTQYSVIEKTNFKNCIVIVDEAHRLKQMALKSPDAYRHLNTGSRLFLLTGTPIYDDESDLAFLINLIARKEVLPWSIEEFKHRFTKISILKSAWVGYWRPLIKTISESPVIASLFQIVSTILVLKTTYGQKTGLFLVARSSGKNVPKENINRIVDNFPRIWKEQTMNNREKMRLISGLTGNHYNNIKNIPMKFKPMLNLSQLSRRMGPIIDSAATVRVNKNSTTMQKWGANIALFHLMFAIPLLTAYTKLIGWLMNDSEWSLRYINKPKLATAVRGYVSYYQAPIGNVKIVEKKVKFVYTYYQLSFFIKFLNDTLKINQLSKLVQDQNVANQEKNIKLKLEKLYTDLHSDLYAGVKIGNLPNKNEVPNKFREIMKTCNGGKIRSIVYSNFTQAGILLFSSYLRSIKCPHVVLLSSETPQQSQGKLKRFNDGECNMLLLDPDFTEGISTKGVRQVHIMEPITVFSKKSQVIARAIRFDSHAHLPSNERRVDVFEYVATCVGKMGIFDWNKIMESTHRWLAGQREYIPGAAPFKRDYRQYKTLLQQDKLLSPDELIITRQKNVSDNVKDILKVFTGVSP